VNTRKQTSKSRNHDKHLMWPCLFASLLLLSGQLLIRHSCGLEADDAGFAMILWLSSVHPGDYNMTTSVPKPYSF